MRSLVPLIFIIIGIWTTFDPKGVVAFKVKLLNMIGVKMKVSIDAKGYKVLRYIGVAVAIAGLLLL